MLHNLNGGLQIATELFLILLASLGAEKYATVDGRQSTVERRQSTYYASSSVVELSIGSVRSV